MSTPESTPKSPDITTKEGWTQECTWWRDHVAKHSATERTLQTRALYLTREVTHNPTLIRELAEPKLCILGSQFVGDDEGEAAKQEFEFFLRAYALAGAAIASISVCEVWLSIHPLTGTDPRTRPGFIRPSQDPNRRDALVIYAAHRSFGRQSWIALLEGKNGGRTAEPWSQGGADPNNRFSAFVPPADVIGNKELQLLALTIIDQHRDSIIWSDRDQYN